eukprot:6850981-Ditylum_brightwellii.AAC.1
MELKFNQIRYLSGETIFMTKQFTIQVFRALLTTTNQYANQYVGGKKDPFDEGNAVDIYSIIKSVCAHYINNRNDVESVDAKDAAIIALMIKDNSLEGKLKNKGGSNTNISGSSNPKGIGNPKKKIPKKNDRLPAWCTTFKGEK